MTNKITTTTINLLEGVKYFEFFFISVNGPEQSHQTL